MQNIYITKTVNFWYDMDKINAIQQFIYFISFFLKLLIWNKFRDLGKWHGCK